jgi:hypothetical protein
VLAQMIVLSLINVRALGMTMPLSLLLRADQG